jgi:hypothetical protein
MIEIFAKVSNSKVLNLSKKVLGNKMDNSITKVIFKEIAEEGQLLNKYVVFCGPDSKIFLFHLNSEDNSFIVSTSITHLSGNWQMLYLATNGEISEDGSIDDNYKVYISNSTTFQITDNFLDGNIDESVLDENLQVIYDELNQTVIYLKSDEFKEELIQNLHLSDEDVQVIINSLKNDEQFKSTITPERGKDYWTPDDVRTIEDYCKNYIDTNILGGVS